MPHLRRPHLRRGDGVEAVAIRRDVVGGPGLTREAAVGDEVLVTKVRGAVSVVRAVARRECHRRVVGAETQGLRARDRVGWIVARVGL